MRSFRYIRQDASGRYILYRESIATFTCSDIPGSFPCTLLAFSYISTKIEYNFTFRMTRISRFDAVSTYFYTTKTWIFSMLKHPTLPCQDLMTLIRATMSFMALPTLLSLKARIFAERHFAVLSMENQVMRVFSFSMIHMHGS